jgi:hypothetical protein
VRKKEGRDGKRVRSSEKKKRGNEKHEERVKYSEELV